MNKRVARLESGAEYLKKVIFCANMTFPKRLPAFVHVCPQNFEHKNKSAEKSRKIKELNCYEQACYNREKIKQNRHLIIQRKQFKRKDLQLWK